MQIEVVDPLTEKRICIEIPVGKNIILIDPYLANLDDLRGQGGSNVIVRLRRPGWGREGALDQAIRIIPIPSEDK